MEKHNLAMAAGTTLDYRNKIILAPMVRIGTLPMRLLALEYGADLVFSPETVDKKVIGCRRIVNSHTGTIDYVTKEGTLAFRTHPREREKLIFQLGTADPELALQAALTVREDVAAFDVNCGCPKRFSLQAGMGAALLRQPEKLCEILKKLVARSGRPVSAKIRIFNNIEETLGLCRMLVSTGISALAVHCRTPTCRPRDPGNWEIFSHISEILTIPLIVNGDVFAREQILQVLALSKASSVMLARAAQWNPSIFRSEGLLPIEEVSKAYLQKCIDTQNPTSNCKYTLMQMWNGYAPNSPFALSLRVCKDMSDLCSVFSIVDHENILTDEQMDLEDE